MHKWDVTPKEAMVIQQELRSKIKIQKLEKKIFSIAGADISLNRFSTTAFAGFIVLSYPDLQPIDRSLAKAEITFPYIPGLLSFREIPALLLAWKNLKVKPDVIIVDGQGIAHPRRMGIATHFGMVVNIPTIGCAKSPLLPVNCEPENSVGCYCDWYDKDEKVGEILRTKVNTKPVYISPGNLTDFTDTLSVVKTCMHGYRIPEPTRLAHNLVNEFRLGKILITSGGYRSRTC